MLQATPKWVINCNSWTYSNNECGRGTRPGGTHCDTRDYKKNKPDYCGQCKYGWRRPWGNANDWCCTWDDLMQSNPLHLHYNPCKCQAEYAPDCRPALSTSGKRQNLYSIKTHVFYLV